MKGTPSFRIVFMGTPEFALDSLDMLVKNGYEIVAAVTVPDKPAGRGRQLKASAVKQYAVEHGLEVLQPESLSDPGFLSRLAELKPDLQVVVAFRLLPEAVWALPPLGTFNLHASLLPDYRGAAPMNWALINGEKETGLTTFFLDRNMDTGQIIRQVRTPVGEDETLGELHDRLKILGAELVLETVRLIESGDVPVIPQNELIRGEGDLKKAPRIFRDDCRIPWHKSAADVHNMIRGLSPYPGAFTQLLSPSGECHEIKIYRTGKSDLNRKLSEGQLSITHNSSLSAGTGSGSIDILELQAPGKKRLRVEEFLRGFPLDENWKLK